jgi:glycosyltransferase involved in cell wall biosynthesis
LEQSSISPIGFEEAAMIIRSLSELNMAAAPRARMNVCVVTSEFDGPTKNGGIGTATSGLVKQLAADGHRVTLLYTSVERGVPASGDKPWSHWVERLEADGVELHFIRHDADYASWREKSWRVKDFIGQNQFDLVYFNDHQGNGYYSLLAKRAGLSPFAEQVHCVITHGSMEWVFDLNDQYAWRARDLELMALERRSVEMADVVIGPSVYLLKTYESYGWKLPTSTYHQPYPLFRAAVVEPPRRVAIDEIVFFGRLEVRKGLWIFCEALDALAKQLHGTTISFLGKMTDTSGVSSGLQIVNRSANWPWRVKLLTDFDRDQALGYLQAGGRLAVMPSLADNSPCVVYECMEAGIPFISTRGSGADELIDPGSWDDVMVQPKASALARKLADVRGRGAWLAQPRFDPNENLTTWSHWHNYVAANRTALAGSSAQSVAARPTTEPTDAKMPLIVVVDDGACTMSLLIDNLRSHLKRFSGRAAYLVLSQRQGDLQEALLHIFEGPEGAPSAPICILDSRTIKEAKHLIFSSALVFFVDARTEVLTSFFALAVNALTRREPTVVSCAVAVRDRTSDVPQIEDLPAGDLPGASSLGDAIGGAVWAMPASRLVDELALLDFYDQQMGAFVSPASFGQMVMQQCRCANVPITVFPMVGAVELREETTKPSTRTFKETRFAASTFGVPQSVHGGSAAWMAISTFGAHQRPSPRTPFVSATPLVARHPLKQLADSAERADLPVMAAAMGRPELSFQLEASRGAASDRARYLMETATRAARLRPSWDLLKFLRRGVVEFGRQPLLGAAGSGVAPRTGRPLSAAATASSSADSITSTASPAAGDDESDHPIRIFVDARSLRLRDTRVQAVKNLTGGSPGKLYFFDVPLCGNASLSVKLRAGPSGSGSVRVVCVDQQTGAEIGAESVNLGSTDKSALSIPLFGIYGRAAIFCQFVCQARMEVLIDEMRVH